MKERTLPPNAFEAKPQYQSIMTEDDHERAKNIIVFGDTGTGKSSIINMLYGGENQHRAKVSSGAGGETFRSDEYHKFLPRDGPRRDFFKVHDTAGINEANAGTITTVQAIENLWQLLGKLDDGVHLLVLVIRGPRLTSTSTKNYELLKVLTEDQVPIALVVTGLENEPNPDEWWRRSKMRFDEAKMRFSAIPACITATRGRVIDSATGECVYDTAYTESIPKVENLFLNAPSSIPYHQDRRSWITRRLVDICDLFGKKAPGFREDLFRLLMTYGIDEKEARKLTNKALTRRGFSIARR